MAPGPSALARLARAPLSRGGSTAAACAPLVRRALTSSAPSLASVGSGAAAGAGARAVPPSPTPVEVTALPNRVRVATEGTPGHFSAVGVYVDAGSRFERTWVPGESGVSHLMDRMAFKSTANRTTEEMEELIQAVGGNVMCSSSRETIMYQSSVFNQDVPKVLSVLADTIQNPLLTSDELALQREAAAWEVSEIWSKPELILPEILHSVAYRNNTLGNPLLCPIESLEVMTTENLREYMRAWYRPERVVVAGAGMPHEELVKLAETYFGGMRAGGPGANAGARRADAASAPSGSAAFSTSAGASAEATSAQSDMFAQIARAPAQYTGGELYIPKPELDLTHVYVAFEGVSIHDDDIYALATLQILLGGGGSFSAGGPGKGMYSRLYTNVLNQYHAVDYCASFHHCYTDSGLFGIAASVLPNFAGSIPYVIARELELCTSGNYRGSVTQDELERAKNQLKSSLVMALESRLVEVEDLGRQVQVHNKKVPVSEMCAMIDRVDLPTLHRVASRVLRAQKPATVVVQGPLDGVEDVRQLLASRSLGVL